MPRSASSCVKQCSYADSSKPGPNAACTRRPASTICDPTCSVEPGIDATLRLLGLVMWHYGFHTSEQSQAVRTANRTNMTLEEDSGRVAPKTRPATNMEPDHATLTYSSCPSCPSWFNSLPRHRAGNDRADIDLRFERAVGAPGGVAQPCGDKAVGYGGGCVAG